MKAINRNKEIGLRVKLLREKRHLSQEALGEAIDVSYQQIQKYENGTTPLTVERLEQIATALDADIIDFIARSAVEKIVKDGEEYKTSKALRFPNVLSEDERKLIKIFRRLANEKLKKVALTQVKTIAIIKKELTGKK